MACAVAYPNGLTTIRIQWILNFIRGTWPCAYNKPQITLNEMFFAVTLHMRFHTADCLQGYAGVNSMYSSS